MSRNKQDECAGVHVRWSPWTPLADLERSAPLFAISTGQSGEEVAESLRHLQHLGVMQVRRAADGRQQFRVRTDSAASMVALLDDHARTCRNYSVSGKEKD